MGGILLSACAHYNGRRPRSRSWHCGKEPGNFAPIPFRAVEERLLGELYDRAAVEDGHRGKEEAMAVANELWISADSHMSEPPDLWQRELPPRLKDRAPIPTLYP